MTSERSAAWSRGSRGASPRTLDGGRGAEGACPYRGLEAFRPEDARVLLRPGEPDRLAGQRPAARGPVVAGGAVPGRCWARRAAASRRSCWPGCAEAEARGDRRERALAGRHHPAGGRPAAQPRGRVGRPRPRPPGTPPDLGRVRQLIEAISRRARCARPLDLFARHGAARPAAGRPAASSSSTSSRRSSPTGRRTTRRGAVRARPARFFANLLNAAAAPGGRVVVVLTMRSDFLGACARSRSSRPCSPATRSWSGR